MQNFLQKVCKLYLSITVSATPFPNPLHLASSDTWQECTQLLVEIYSNHSYTSLFATITLWPGHFLTSFASILFICFSTSTTIQYHCRPSTGNCSCFQYSVYSTANLTQTLSLYNEATETVLSYLENTVFPIFNFNRSNSTTAASLVHSYAL